MALEREATQVERKRLMLYLIAGVGVPVALIGATQGWGNIANDISKLRFDSLYSRARKERKWREVDLSAIPDEAVPPVTRLRSCGCGCGKDAVASGNYEVAGGMLWLKEHFHCADCACPLVGKMRMRPLTRNVGDESWVFFQAGKLYCADHYSARFCNTCSHCHHQISKSDFLLDPHTGRASCVPCYNSVGENAFASIPEVNEEEGKHLFKEVKEGLTDLLGIDFGKESDSPLHDLPLCIVDPKDMLAVKNSATWVKSSTPSLGLTVKTRSKDKEFFQPQKVLVLKGMNELKTGSVMAHELMHCWLALNVLNGKERDNLLPLDVEEGLCELIAYLWLLNEKQSKKISAPTGMDDVQVELVRMENNDERQQGLSFHQAFHALQGRTFKELLTAVVKEGRFPSP